MNHDLVAARAAKEIIELLRLCQQLQSEKDFRIPSTAQGALRHDRKDSLNFIVL